MDTPRRATLYGLIAVAAFAATLPLTRVALEGFPPMALTFGRLTGAALAALAALAMVGARFPERRHWGALLVVAIGGAGFPLLVALALENHPSAPGAIPLALIPLAVAAWTRSRGHERPAPSFWLWAAAGAGLVLHFAWVDGAGQVAPEIYLAALVVAPAYAEGGRLAREMPGWRVMAWAVVIAAPLSAVGFGYLSAVGEAESLPGGLGGEARLEQFRYDLLGHAFTGVGHGYFYAAVACGCGYG